MRVSARSCLAAMLLLSSCATVPLVDPPGQTGSDAGQARGSPVRCVPASTSLPLLGNPGDSPIVPVRVQGRDAAMFFSPGLVPVLFSNNGAVSFPRFQSLDLRMQDDEVVSVFASLARGLFVGDVGPANRTGFLLADPDDRTANGRPIVGMLGRDILSDNTVVDLDIPARRLTVSVVQPACPNLSYDPAIHPIDMEQEVLMVPVRINGQPVQAVLEPDLPVSILPGRLAGRVGLRDTDLADDPTVVTKFGQRVLGRRHRVQTLDVGDTQLRNFAFDVEDDVPYVMLGLNLFQLGQATFDFARQKFFFRQTTDKLPPPTDVHFNQTKLPRVSVDQ